MFFVDDLYTQIYSRPRPSQTSSQRYRPRLIDLDLELVKALHSNPEFNTDLDLDPELDLNLESDLDPGLDPGLRCTHQNISIFLTTIYISHLLPEMNEADW